MKTLTEFSTLSLRRAKAAAAAHSTLQGDELTEKLAAELSVPSERVPRILEALEIVGSDVETIRLVRVFQGEKAPLGAISKGEFHYVVDRIVAPKPKREEPAQAGGDRPRRGGGERDKPRGLGALMALANKEPKPQTEDDRPGRGEMPRAGIGWQLTSAPRDDRGGKGGPRKGGKGPRRDGERRPRPPRLGPDGNPLPPREPRPARLGPDGKPFERKPRRDGDRGPRQAAPGQAPGEAKPKRERPPIGPDANGNGPDGQPWDPERRAKRLAERDARKPQGDAQAPATEATKASE